MKLYISLFLFVIGGSSFAQQTNSAKWQKAIVKLISIQQRYTFAQVDVLLQKQIDTIKSLSQHDKYNRQGELLTIRDTIRGTALLIADGDKVYLVTAKHLIKATENEGNNLESINELISIKANVAGKVSNEIPLMNLSANTVNLRPFIFSSDEIDIGIISFQKPAYKPILAYLKEMGCVPIPISAINKLDNVDSGDEISVMGFPALSGGGVNNLVQVNGNIGQADKSLHSFTANLSVYPGNCGGPVIKGNKLIGILSFQSGIATNIDAAMHPFDKANSALAIKAANILPLLRRLQDHGF